MPVLLREARGAYSLAIRRGLAPLGLEELPRYSAFVLGALTRGAMLIANSHDPVATRHSVADSMRGLLNSFAAT